MLQIISGFWISRAVYVIAKLGIPDLSRAGPRPADELAESTQTHGPCLYRVLRALASVEVLGSEGGRFGLTELSETPVTDAPGSLRWFTGSELGQEHYPAWGNLTGGKERTEPEFARLLDGAGFKLLRVIPTEGPTSIIEAAPV